MKKAEPSCNFGKFDCFAFYDGTCRVLKSTNFPTGRCPFYKTQQEACANDMRRLQRLRSINLPPREVPEHG